MNPTAKALIDLTVSMMNVCEAVRVANIRCDLKRKGMSQSLVPLVALPGTLQHRAGVRALWAQYD